MKFSINADELEKALRRVKTVIEAKANSIPSLSNVLIETVSPTVVRFIGSDLETSLTSENNADVSENGSMSIPVKLISAVSDNIKTGVLSFSSDDKNVMTVTSGGRTSKIKGLPGSDYPRIPQIDTEFSAVNSVHLSEVLSGAMFSASKDESRPVFKSIFIEASGDGSVKATSTDGHRLGTFTRQSEATTCRFEEGIIVSKKSASAIKKILDENTFIDCNVALKDNCLLVKKQDITITVRLIDGEFPDCSGAIPSEGIDDDGIVPISFVVKASELSSGVKYVQNFSDQKGTVLMTLEGGSLHLSSNSSDCSGTETISVEASEGEKKMVALNPSYMLDALSSLSCENVRIWLRSGEAPIMLKPVVDGTSDVCIIMPIRV